MSKPKVTPAPFGYTIYQNPRDYPDHYVLRGWYIDDGVRMEVAGLATPINDKALETLRSSMVEMGLHCVGRAPSDDPVILESWI